MSWRERVDGSIILYSPSQSLFRAAWIGDKRVMDKKLGIFELPLVQGAIIQDLDVGPVRHPMSIYFEGEDNDLNADRFFTACRERGPWTIIHPVLGKVTRQLISVAQEIQPVTSGNISQFDLEWVEPGIQVPVGSVSMLPAKVYALRAEVDAKLGNVPLELSDPSLIAQVLGYIARLQNLYSTVTGYYQTAMSAIAFVVSTASSLVSAVVDLVELPGMVIQDIRGRFKYFGGILSASWGSLESAVGNFGGSDAERAAVCNAAAVTEVVFAAAMLGMAQSIVEAGFKSRKEALSYLDAFNAAFLTGVTNLDRAQAAFHGAPIDQQYFSLTGTYADLLAMLQTVSDLVLHRAFGLATVKYITLQHDRAPVEISITEGVDFDVFLDVNQLSGTDILLLPAGRKVAVYL